MTEMEPVTADVLRAVAPMDRCAQSLAETLKWEGGYSNHPQDPGGATMQGVTQRVYDGYRMRRGLAKRAVRLIEQSELLAIYQGSYWAAVRGDELPAGVDLAMFDFGVNSGPGRAITVLQQALGVKADGHLGDATLGVAATMDASGLVRKLMAGRRQFLRGLSTFPTFGKGWMNRCSGIENAALTMSAAAPSSMLAVAYAAPIADPDLQSAEQGRAYEPTTPSTQHAEAHEMLQADRLLYWGNRLNLKALGMAAAGVAAFVKDHTIEIVAGLLLAIVVFEIWQYSQRKKVMSNA